MQILKPSSCETFFLVAVFRVWGLRLRVWGGGFPKIGGVPFWGSPWQRSSYVRVYFGAPLLKDIHVGAEEQ